MSGKFFSQFFVCGIRLGFCSLSPRVVEHRFRRRWVIGIRSDGARSVDWSRVRERFVSGLVSVWTISTRADRKAVIQVRNVFIIIASRGKLFVSVIVNRRGRIFIISDRPAIPCSHATRDATSAGRRLAWSVCAQATAFGGKRVTNDRSRQTIILFDFIERTVDLLVKRGRGVVMSFVSIHAIRLRKRQPKKEIFDMLRLCTGVAAVRRFRAERVVDSITSTIAVFAFRKDAAVFRAKARGAVIRGHTRTDAAVAGAFADVGA